MRRTAVLWGAMLAAVAASAQADELDASMAAYRRALPAMRRRRAASIAAAPRGLRTMQRPPARGSVGRGAPPSATAWSLAAAAAAAAGEADERDDDAPNLGQDRLKPLRRIDYRFLYEKTTGNLDAYIHTIRVDGPIPIAAGAQGKLVPRIDIPVVHTNRPSRDNPSGGYVCGAGTLLTQLVWVPPASMTPTDLIDGWGFGARLQWPTESQDSLGSGKYVAAPLFTFKENLFSITETSFFLPVLGYFRDFAETSGGRGRPDVNELAFQPQLYIFTRPWGWPIDFVHLYPTFDMRFNFHSGGGKKSGRTFIPVDLMLGKMIAPRTVVSVEYAHALVDDYDLYEWRIEFRVGFFF